MKLEQILAFLRQLRRLPAVYYIGGSEILPPPLSPEEEAAAAAACQAGDEGARRTLIEHNLRLVVFLARKFESSLLQRVFYVRTLSCANQLILRK